MSVITHYLTKCHCRRPGSVFLRTFPWTLRIALRFPLGNFSRGWTSHIISLFRGQVLQLLLSWWPLINSLQFGLGQPNQVTTPRMDLMCAEWWGRWLPPLTYCPCFYTSRAWKAVDVFCYQGTLLSYIYAMTSGTFSLELLHALPDSLQGLPSLGQDFACWSLQRSCQSK